MQQQALSVVDAVKNAIPDAIQEVIEFRGETTLVVAPEKLVEVATFCRDHEGLEFNLLSDLTSADYYPAEPRFAMNYHLYSVYFRTRVRLKVYLPGENPEVDSVTSIWPAANWQEREVFDLMGIQIKNHPDLRRILLPNDWIGHPLRKDYPLGYEPVQFSFNFDEIMRQKPHATE
jgi:NADH-quinone oxidoreductase subunit C